MVRFNSIRNTSHISWFTGSAIKQLTRIGFRIFIVMVTDMSAHVPEFKNALDSHDFNPSESLIEVT